MSMRICLRRASNGPPRRRVIAVLLAGVLCSVASCGQSSPNRALPALHSDVAPLAPENRELLHQRFVAAFDQRYIAHQAKNKSRNLADHFQAYYLRQELQALIDMWRATGTLSYLQQAKKLTFQAMDDARSSPRPLLLGGRSRGTWPCFFLKTVEKQTGGHNQLNDFQGAAGLLMVASALKEGGQQGSAEIADFVEKNIIEKWLYYRPTATRSLLTGQQSNMYLLAAVDVARDKREHFATICMDLDKLGYSKYPYHQWARLLTDLYVSIRPEPNQQPPLARELGRHAPSDWGLVRKESTKGLYWYYVPDWRDRSKLAVLDTGHANRTVWLAGKAYSNGLIDKTVIDGLVSTLKSQVWKPEKNPFYFANYVDGHDRPYDDKRHGSLPPGYKGHVWFGWHRLAAYDSALNDLFLSLALDLTNGGNNMPVSQNKTMDNAPPCFYAWAARLTSPDGKTQVFP